MKIELNEDDVKFMIDIIKNRQKSMAQQVLDLKAEKMSVEAGYFRLSDDEKKSITNVFETYNKQFDDFMAEYNQEDLMMEKILAKLKENVNDTASVE